MSEGSTEKTKEKKMENAQENIDISWRHEMMLKRSKRCLIGVLKEQESQNEAEVICEERENLRLSRLMKNTR